MLKIDDPPVFPTTFSLSTLIDFIFDYIYWIIMVPLQAIQEVWGSF